MVLGGSGRDLERVISNSSASVLLILGISADFVAQLEHLGVIGDRPWVRPTPSTPEPLLPTRINRVVEHQLLGLELLDLRCLDRLWSLECVVLEETLLDSAIREHHAADTILDALYPLTLVARAVLPVHFSVTVPLIVSVAALVEIATFPGELAHSILLVVVVVALVHVAVLCVEALTPLTLSVLEAILKFTNVNTAILPLILACTLWLTTSVGAGKHVAICEDI